MAEVSAAAVKALRELTNLPMMDCKKALQQAEGHQEKAIELLRQQAGKVVLKRAENPTSEGRIAYAIKADGSLGAMVELQCESPPVGKNEDFIGIAQLCAQQLAEGPGAATPDELLSQPAPGKSGQTLRQVLEEVVNKIRENMKLARIIRVPGPVAGYVHHDGKQAVLFQAAGENATDPVLRDVAMHIVALKPSVTFPEQLDPAKVQAERDRLTAEAKASGKPDNVIAKMVDGRLKAFYIENGVLVHQPFAKEDTKSVSQILAEKGLKAVGYTKWLLGN